MFAFQVIRPLPYQFTADVYVPTTPDVCPGDVITYTRGVVIEGEATALLSSVWVDPQSGRAIYPSRLGDALVSTWRSHDHVAEYYSAQGRGIVLTPLPLTITRTLTATVPTAVAYDAPLVLEVSTVVGAPARYTVPVWVLPESDCK